MGHPNETGFGLITLKTLQFATQEKEKRNGNELKEAARRDKHWNVAEILTSSWKYFTQLRRFR